MDKTETIGLRDPRSVLVIANCVAASLTVLLFGFAMARLRRVGFNPLALDLGAWAGFGIAVAGAFGTRSWGRRLVEGRTLSPLLGFVCTAALVLALVDGGIAGIMLEVRPLWTTVGSPEWWRAGAQLKGGVTVGPK